MSDAARANPISLYIDADACPVKQEIYRVAERHAGKGVSLKVFVVSNSPIAVPRDDLIERVVVGAGMDEADNWIAERAKRGDIVITADVPLASRAVKAGAEVIAPNGKPFTEESIGMALATRNLLDSLRSAGEITGGPKPFAPRDRSEFLSALDRAIVRMTREGFGRADGSAPELPAFPARGAARSGAPQMRSSRTRACCDPGSAAHHFALRYARETWSQVY